jgi:hypothetical protein
MAVRPDIAVVEVGAFDVADRLLAGDSHWRAPGDPIYDSYLKSEMLQATDVFLSRGIHVVWLTSPDIDDQVDLPPGATGPENDPARTTRFNEILHEVATERPGLKVVDLADWVRRWPRGPFDPALRPDGCISLPRRRRPMSPRGSSPRSCGPWDLPILVLVPNGPRVSQS